MSQSYWNIVLNSKVNPNVSRKTATKLAIVRE